VFALIVWVYRLLPLSGFIFCLLCLGGLFVAFARVSSSTNPIFIPRTSSLHCIPLHPKSFIRRPIIVLNTAPILRTHQNPNDTMEQSNVQKFWVDFDPPEGTQFYQTAKFWKTYGRHSATNKHRTRRSQSLPPSWPRATSATGAVARRLNRRLHTQVQAKVPSTPLPKHSVLRKVWSGIRKTANNVGQQLRAYRRPLLYAAAGLGTVCVASWMLRNAIAYNAQSDPITKQYRSYPQFLHTKNAYTVLDLPEPWYESWVPPQDVFRAAVRKINGDWHVDKWRRSGCDSREEAEAIFAVYDTAIARFKAYYDNPLCALKTWGPEHADAGLLAPIPDVQMPNNITLPHYDRSPPPCTLWSATSAAVRGVFTNPRDLPQMPATPAEREAYYPCSLNKAIADTYTNLRNIPPVRVPRFWNSPELKGATFIRNPINWLVHFVGKPVSYNRGPIEWNETEVMQGSMRRWLVSQDFVRVPSFRVCKPIHTEYWNAV